VDPFALELCSGIERGCAFPAEHRDMVSGLDEFARLEGVNVVGTRNVGDTALPRSAYGITI
jgi:hypothetical protein